MASPAATNSTSEEWDWKGSCHPPTLTPQGRFVKQSRENWMRDRRVGGQPEAPLHQDKGRKAVNNKLIRNGCKIAMDEKLDRVQGKKKANHWAVSCEPPSIMWGLTSYQQSEQELHLINQSWQLLLGHISSTAFPHPLVQLPLGFTFCWYQLHCPASFPALDLLIPWLRSKITTYPINVDEDKDHNFGKERQFSLTSSKPLFNRVYSINIRI